MPATGPVPGKEGRIFGLRKLTVLTLVLGSPNILFLFYQIPSCFSADTTERCLPNSPCLVCIHLAHQPPYKLASWRKEETGSVHSSMFGFLGRGLAPGMLRETLPPPLPARTGDSLRIRETYPQHLRQRARLKIEHRRGDHLLTFSSAMFQFSLFLFAWRKGTKKEGESSNYKGPVSLSHTIFNPV